MTPLGIDPGTVRLVAQRLNHYATPGQLMLMSDKLPRKGSTTSKSGINSFSLALCPNNRKKFPFFLPPTYTTVQKRGKFKKYVILNFFLISTEKMQLFNDRAQSKMLCYFLSYVSGWAWVGVVVKALRY